MVDSAGMWLLSSHLGPHVNEPLPTLMFVSSIKTHLFTKVNFGAIMGSLEYVALSVSLSLVRGGG